MIQFSHHYYTLLLNYMSFFIIIIIIFLFYCETDLFIMVLQSSQSTIVQSERFLSSHHSSTQIVLTWKVWKQKQRKKFGQKLQQSYNHQQRAHDMSHLQEIRCGSRIWKRHTIVWGPSSLRHPRGLPVTEQIPSLANDFFWGNCFVLLFSFFTSQWNHFNSKIQFFEQIFILYIFCVSKPERIIQYFYLWFCVLLKFGTYLAILSPLNFFLM